MLILVDGERRAPDDATVSIFDATVLRGDGCFEGLRSYGGRAFAKDAHLDRLEHSARQLRMTLPPRAELARWIDQVAETEESALIRVLVTAGVREAPHQAAPRTFVYPEPLAALPDEGLSVLPVLAPWHPAGLPWSLNGVKSLSYGPNVAARREASEAGFHDALLVGREDLVLEGPTWTVAWWKDEALYTPELDLGILASITRSVVIEVAKEAGLQVREGVFKVHELYGAEEIFALATSKEVLPVTRLGAFGANSARSLPRGPRGAQLLAAFRERVARETG